MARTSQNVRNARGQYIKVTLLNKIKAFCNRIILKIESWIKATEKS